MSPVEVYDVFVDTLKDIVETGQNLNVVLTEFLISVLQHLCGKYVIFHTYMYSQPTESG